jgi:hypothetical protein
MRQCVTACAHLTATYHTTLLTSKTARAPIGGRKPEASLGVRKSSPSQRGKEKERPARMPGKPSPMGPSPPSICLLPCSEEERVAPVLHAAQAPERHGYAYDDGQQRSPPSRRQRGERLSLFLILTQRFLQAPAAEMASWACKGVWVRDAPGRSGLTRGEMRPMPNILLLLLLLFLLLLKLLLLLPGHAGIIQARILNAPHASSTPRTHTATLPPASAHASSDAVGPCCCLPPLRWRA